MEKLTFSTLQLICETEKQGLRFIDPQNNHFKGLPSEFKYTENKIYYKLISELTEQYFWLAAEYGKPEPHRDNWVDIETDLEDTNQRKNTQVELTKQTFLLYHFERKLLYLSNSQQIKLYSKILAEKTEMDFHIKRQFCDFNEFVSILKSVESIKFTGFKNLFSSDSKQYKAIEDLTGTNAPESFFIEAKYKKANIIDFIRNLHKSRQEQKIDKLVICGLDESGLETIYNVETFTNQISISCERNNEGVFDHNTIKTELLKKIEQK